MNVIGSRPTGWWRDRPGAMRELVEELKAFAERERRARDGGARRQAVRARGRSSGVSVLFASRRGPNAADDDIAALVEARRRPGGPVSRDLGRRPRSARPRGRGEPLWAPASSAAGSTASRSSTTARQPRAGTTVTCRMDPRSGLCDGARRRTRRRTSRSTVRISTCANEAPMQRRTPPPNGIQAYDSAPPFKKRSGRNSSGDSYRSGRAWSTAIAGQHERAGGQPPAGHLGVSGELAGHVHDHRPHAQRLLHDRVDVVVVVQRGGQALQHLRRAQQALERPREAGGGRLVPGGEQRHQLVAQLDVGHRRAVLVARAQQQREHVVALLRRRRRHGGRRSRRRSARPRRRARAGSAPRA